MIAGVAMPSPWCAPGPGEEPIPIGEPEIDEGYGDDEDDDDEEDDDEEEE